MASAIKIQSFGSGQNVEEAYATVFKSLHTSRLDATDC